MYIGRPGGLLRARPLVVCRQEQNTEQEEKEGNPEPRGASPRLKAGSNASARLISACRGVVDGGEL